MITIINFWFTQTVAMSVYRVIHSRSILASNDKALPLPFPALNDGA